MSKTGKLLVALQKNPRPTDFTWGELVTLMRKAGFIESCNSGSHYMFEHHSGFRFRMSKSHPAGVLKPYQVDSAKEALRTIGFTGEKESD